MRSSTSGRVDAGASPISIARRDEPARVGATTADAVVDLDDGVARLDPGADRRGDR